MVIKKVVIGKGFDKQKLINLVSSQENLEVIEIDYNMPLNHYLVNAKPLNKSGYLFVGFDIDKLDKRKISPLIKFIDKSKHQVLFFANNKKAISKRILNIFEVVMKGEEEDEPIDIFKLIDRFLIMDRKELYNHVVTKGFFSPGLLSLLEPRFLGLDEKQNIYKVLNLINNHIYKTDNKFVCGAMVFNIPKLNKRTFPRWGNKKNDKEINNIAETYSIGRSEVRKSFWLLKNL